MRAISSQKLRIWQTWPIHGPKLDISWECILEQIGLYTKIGNFVHGTIVITWDDQASTGQVGFSLPFASANIAGTRTSGFFTYQDGLNIPSGQGSTHLILYGGNNSSNIYAYFAGGTNNCEIGTNSTQLTGSITSSNNTCRMVFHYRTA